MPLGAGDDAYLRRANRPGCARPAIMVFMRDDEDDARPPTTRISPTLLTLLIGVSSVVGVAAVAVGERVAGLGALWLAAAFGGQWWSERSKARAWEERHPN